jgi:hypothetical protein
LGLLLL